LFSPATKNTITTYNKCVSVTSTCSINFWFWQIMVYPVLYSMCLTTNMRLGMKKSTRQLTFTLEMFLSRSVNNTLSSYY